MDYLRRQRTTKELSAKEVGIVVIYLKYNDLEQTLESILGSFVMQLAQEHDPLPTFLQDLYDRHRNQNTSPTLEVLSNALVSLIKSYKRLFIVVDALDECSDETRWGLMEILRCLEPQVRIMVTSRFLDSIDEELQDFERIEIKANKADLELFIDQHIRKNKHLRKAVEKSSNLSEDIKTAVVKTAEDMYLPF